MTKKMSPEEAELLGKVVETLQTPRTRLELERTWQGKPCVRLLGHQLTKGGNDKWAPRAHSGQTRTTHGA
jgi:hypothetical protein